MAKPKIDPQLKLEHQRSYMKEYQRKRAKQARYGACLTHAQELASRLVGTPEDRWETIIMNYLLEETKLKS